MTAQELINILSGRYPSENVTIQSEGGRNIQVIGIDEKLSSQYGCIVLKTVWSYADKVVESEEDKLKRQREEINKQLGKMRAEEAKAKKAAAKKPAKKKKRKKNATASEQVAKGVVPTGKRGRPRKMVEDNDFVRELAETNDLDTLAKKMAKKTGKTKEKTPSDDA